MERILNKAGFITMTVLALLLLAALATVARGGPLDPVATPGPTQANLIFQPTGACPTGFPIPISAPGSYKLAQNITGCSGQGGISITASGVTLDLGGFTLKGVAGSLDGINVTFDAIVRNGVISDWGGTGLVGSSVAADLGLYRNFYGLSGSGKASNITTWLNEGFGINLSSGSVDGCTSGGDNVGNLSTGSIILGKAEMTNCDVTFANGDGIIATNSTLTHCTVNGDVSSVGNNINALNSTIDDCTANGGKGTGFLLTRSKIHGCTANNHTTGTGKGIVAFHSTVSDCTATGNASTGITVTNSTLSDCTANVNTANGGIIATDSTIETCTANGNTGGGTGITLLSGSNLRGCTTEGNGGNGILSSGTGALIEGCQVSANNSEGIKITGMNNTVVRNHASGNSTGFGNAEIYANAAGTIVEDNTLVNTVSGHVGVYADVAGTVVLGNTARNGVAGSDYFTAGTCGCDIGTVTTALGASNPRGNVGD